MATTEEKQELVEELKGPRYYTVRIMGYGCESGYLSLTKDQYDFWQKLNEDDPDLVASYFLDPDDFTEVEIPDGCAFLYNEEEQFNAMWYDCENLVEHQYGVDFNHATIEIEEVSDNDWGASVLNEIVRKDIEEYTEENEIEVDMGVTETDEPEFTVQILNTEKGCFFDGLIETTGEFDPSKLKIYTMEYWNGDDTIVNVEYKGEDIDNNGGDTNGKGTSAYFWRN